MKQDCEICQQWMEEAFVGELAPPLQKSLSEHVQSCSACQNFWQEYQDLHRGMESLEKFEEPSNLTSARILKAAEKNSASKQIHPIWKFLFSPAAMAAAMLVLIVGVGLYSHKWIQTHREEPALAPLAAPPSGLSPGLTPVLHEEGILKRESKRPLPEAKPLTNAAPPPAKEEENAADRYFKSKAIQGLPAQPSAILSPQGGAGGIVSPPVAPAQRLMMPATSSGNADILNQGEKSKASSEQAIPNSQILISSAKIKMQAQDYSGALQDLLSAQSIKDSAEIRKLIAVCQSYLQK